MKAERAVAIGNEALIWLAGEPEALGGFLAAGGATAADVRARAADPEFLGFLLEYLLGSDAMLVAFADAGGPRPEEVARARAVLGGEVPHWT